MKSLKETCDIYKTFSKSVFLFR